MKHATMIGLFLVLILQHPTTSATAPLLKSGNQLQSLFELQGCLWCGAEPVEVVNQHLGVHTPAMIREVVSNQLAKILALGQTRSASSRR